MPIHNTGILDIKTLDIKDESKVGLFIEQNINLVRKAIKGFLGHKHSLEYDDLMQLGTLGMYKAIMKFDNSFGTRFSTYAVPMIVGEIRRFIRDNGSSVRVPRDLYKMYGEYMRMAEKYTHEEIASELGYAPEVLDEVFKIQSILNSNSLDAPVKDGAELDKEVEGYSRTPSNLNTENEALANIMHLEMLKFIEQKLGKQAREIIEARMDGATQADLGERFGIGQVQVSRLIQRMGRVLQNGFKDLDISNRPKAQVSSKQVIMNKGESLVSVRAEYKKSIDFVKQWLIDNKGETLDLNRILEANGYYSITDKTKAAYITDMIKKELVSEGYKLDYRREGVKAHKKYFVVGEAEKKEDKPVTEMPAKVIVDDTALQLLEVEIAKMKNLLTAKDGFITTLTQESEEKIGSLNTEIETLQQTIQDMTVMMKALRLEIKEYEDKEQAVKEEEQSGKKMLHIDGLELEYTDEDNEGVLEMVKSLCTSLLTICGIAFKKKKKIKINIDVTEL